MSVPTPLKRALVLSGGGSRGAWQVGAINALLESGRCWTSVHGVSVGALNGAFLAMHPPWEQFKQIKNLLKLWQNIKDSNDIYKPWFDFKPVNYVMSMFKGSINSGEPLENLVSSIWDKEKIERSGVNFTVGCTSLSTGEYRHFNQYHENFFKYVLASSHLPIIFPPLFIDSHLWVDGGIRHQIPFSEALAEEPDEIDVILTAPLRVSDRLGQLSVAASAPKTAIRASEIMSDQIYANDVRFVLAFIDNHHKKCKVNIFAPKVLPTQNSMDFNNEFIKFNIGLGYEETKKQLTKNKLVKSFKKKKKSSKK